MIMWVGGGGGGGYYHFTFFFADLDSFCPWSFINFSILWDINVIVLLLTWTWNRVKIGMKNIFAISQLLAVDQSFTVELRWLKPLWDHGNLFETAVVRAKEGNY